MKQIGSEIKAWLRQVASSSALLAAFGLLIALIDRENLPPPPEWALLTASCGGFIGSFVYRSRSAGETPLSKSMLWLLSTIWGVLFLISADALDASSSDGPFLVSLGYAIVTYGVISLICFMPQRWIKGSRSDAA